MSFTSGGFLGQVLRASRKSSSEQKQTSQKIGGEEEASIRVHRGSLKDGREVTELATGTLRMTRNDRYDRNDRKRVHRDTRGGGNVT